MMRYATCGFIALEAFAEITFDDESTAHKDLDRAVDRRRTCVGTMGAQFLRDFLGGEMSIGAKDDVSNCETLRRYGEVVLAQIAAERIASAPPCIDRSGFAVGVVAHVNATVLSGVRSEVRGRFARR